MKEVGTCVVVSGTRISEAVTPHFALKRTSKRQIIILFGEINT
jgi:hypothetical protein